MISHNWRIWIAENLMLGVAEADVLSKLVESGYPHDEAGEAVAEAAASPFAAMAIRMSRQVAKRDWLLANYAKLEALSGVDQAIPRVSAISPEQFFEDFYYPNRPVILTDLIDDWPAIQHWSLDYLGSRCGNPVIEVQAGRESEASYELLSVSLKRRVLWQNLLDVLRADRTTNDFYITANNDGLNRQALAALWEDIGPLNGILQPGAAQDGFFWLGPRGTITPWHHDLTNNLLVQIRGRKRVTLASAAQTPRMQNFHHCYSRFNSDASLAQLSPEARPATVSCDLGPGEILFIPIGWWHHVQGLDLSISMSFVNFVKDNDFSSYYRSFGDL